MAAPFVFNYSDNSLALWISLVIGAATVVLSWAEGIQTQERQWEDWAVVVLGIAAIVAPFVFGFSAVSAMWTLVVGGGLMAMAAGLRLTQYGKT